MVDPIGIKPGTVAERRPAPVAAVTPAAAVRSLGRAEPDATESTSATLLSRAMAAEAPVDSERVSRIRKAIQDGRFPLYPATVADRLLALKLDWNPNEPA